MTDRNEAMRLAEWLRQNSSGIYRPAADAADMLDKQAERIAELELQPVFAQLASDLAEKLAATEAQRDQLRAEVERLRADAERYQWLRAEHQRPDPICHLSWKRNGDRSSCEWVNTADLDAAIDAARTTHKDEA